MKSLQEMIKKDTTFRWDLREKDAFARIKQAIAEAMILYTPNFNKDFLLYIFASNTSITTILT